MPAHTSTHLTPLAKALMMRHALRSKLSLSGLGMMMAMGMAAHVQAQEWTLKIPAQPLDQALQRFAEQVNIQVLYSPSDVQQLRSTALNGRYDLDRSISTLLQGTGIQYQLSGNTLTLQPASSGKALELGATNVKGTQLAATTEGTGSYTTGSSNTATGLNLSLKETPQSVSVVTQQMIKDRHYESLDQALNHTPGILVKQDTGDTRWEYWARGSVINTIQYDGLTSPIQTFTRDVTADDDLVIYDRVEVVRGATGLMTGAGNPSASVNLIRKHSTAQPQASLSTSVSSWGNIRSTFDGSTPLNDAGTVRGRTVISGFTGKNQRNSSESDNGLLYGVLDMDLSSSTTASVGFTYQVQNNDGYSWTGLPTRRDGSFYDFDQGSFVGSDWFYLDRRQTTLYADIEHRFDNDWKLKAAARGIKAESDYVSGSGYLIGSNYFREDYDVDYEDESHSFNLDLSGPFNALGRTHELMLGVSSGRDHIWTGGGFVPDTFVGNVETYNYRSIPKPDLNQNLYTRGFTVQQHGLFAATRLNLADSLKLILGSRVSWYENKSFTLNDFGYTPANYSVKGEVVPYVGLVYDFNDTYSAYASYTEIFNPQSAVDRQGRLLDPVEGTNAELGIKASFAEERLNLSTAVFETKRTNLAVSLPSISCNAGIQSCYEAAQEVRTRGVEFEVNGEIQPGWNVQAGYTWSQSEYIEGDNKGQAYGTESSPKHLAKVGTTYRLPGIWQALTVGSSVRAQSKTFYKGSDYYIEQPTFAVVDAMARYTFNDRVSLQLNVNNLFDREYYQTITTTYHSGNFIGPGRNALLTLDYNFW
ncbi:TonB-dependent siderophore receptor [Pseudomonas sp. 21LCFQ02]|uniref:TonB-dependent siderophore receptor n=1 Tax=Pseudomonas sp. 21LCFQ02 TaxID=2957505 RepID=UPI00209B9F27|nr:TonB-dependent receptor [Pseudomonas sp. 21LCFQ02]MCO8171479.1 TonB-dependent siderophore receptor [Pseudomonas sp. 21LCFQ02]